LTREPGRHAPEGRTGRIHFVYPHGPSISCPDAIGRNVGQRLKQHYELLQYEWDDTRVIEPSGGDVLLGHPHPAPWTVFRRSARRRGWRRIIMMSPYNHDPRQVAFVDPLVPRCDLYLTITGSFWFDSVDGSPFSHWRPKMVHVDLAIDRRDFPIVKRRFNPAGSRRFLYIGHGGWQKNVRYLEQLAQTMPGAAISWMGQGHTPLRGLTRLGYQDFTSESARRLVSTHDFLLTVGTADSNPATVLEAMAWGLIPVCTPTSGYEGRPGIITIPPDDPSGALLVLERLQSTPQDVLHGMQAANWNALDTHFNWDRFASQVRDAIESTASPGTLREGLARRAKLQVAALVSPLSMFRRRNIRMLGQRLELTEPTPSGGERLS
jgi:glycosyltransferase involved in cell wall biosynthesis